MTQEQKENILSLASGILECTEADEHLKNYRGL
jgi:hypothetical protein